MPQTSRSLLLFPGLALGIYLGSLGWFTACHLLLALMGLVVVWLYLAYRGRASNGWLFGLIVIVGMLLVGYISVLPEQAWLVPRDGEFSGQVYRVQELSFDQRVFVELRKTRERVALHLPLEARIEPGAEITFSGTISQPRKAPNPGVFCYRQYLRGLGVFGTCYPDAYVVHGNARVGVLSRLRNRLRQNVLAEVGDPGLILALVLGQRDLLGERQEVWRGLGISHLLAISGMHVGLVALGLGLIVKRLPLRPLWRLFLIQGTLLMYILVAGSGASGWRALLVSSLGGYATWRGQRQDPLHIWATVGWLLLLVKPTLIFDMGFTLSFVASGGILLWGPSLRVAHRSRMLSYVASSLIISTIAQLSLAPLLLAYFGEIALLGSLATLVFLPLVAIIMIGGFFVALGFGPLGLGAALNGVMHLVDALERTLLPFAGHLLLGSWTRLEIYLCWLFFVYAGWNLRKPRLTQPKRTTARLAAMAVILFFILSLPPLVRRPLEITALNVGQGDCYFVKTPSGVHLLIDGGGDSPYWQQRGRNVGEERLVPYLQHRQVSRIDYVILSHPHDDHLFGLLAVLDQFDVGMVIDNGHEHASPTYERYLDLIEQKEIGYHEARAGEQLNLGDGITLTILYPKALRENLPSAHNNNSLLVRLQYGGVRMLFTGDLENAVLYDLVRDSFCDLKAEWLKVPHHGSEGSALAEFYEAVDPNWAVISVGQNSFGHPHQEVLDRLDEHKVTWRTTWEGPQIFHVWWGFWGRFSLPSS